jgi:hypothetical protein
LCLFLCTQYIRDAESIALQTTFISESLFVQKIEIWDEVVLWDTGYIHTAKFISCLFGIEFLWMTALKAWSVLFRWKAAYRRGKTSG